jgi:tRNA(fMet)-specific endonuclease VapC
MALTHLLDTSIYSQPIRDVPNDRVMMRWSEHPDSHVCISSIVHAEVLQGLIDRDSSKYWRRYRELLENHYTILPFDTVVSETYSKLVVKLKQTGKPRPMADLMIAATAIQHGLILATLNVKDFKDIPGLIVENWGK